MLANHLWQSTLAGAVAGLLALALRTNHARARYWIWLTASVKFLIPFSVLVGIGSHLGWPAIPATAAAGLSTTVKQIGQPFTATAGLSSVSLAPVPVAANWLPAVLFAVWACGFLAVTLFWWVRWRRIRAAVCAGSPLQFESDVPVLSSPVLLEPGVFGIFRPVLLLPEGIAEHLDPAQFKAILAHELCHVRRRDNLTAAIHMLVEALFWFHPLVWWLGARLVEERERACDEEVLRLGSRPEVYAEGILKTCQFYLESPLVCASGVTGSDLKQRIVRIMTQRVSKKLDFGKRALLAAAGIAVVAGPIVFGLMNSPQGRAQSQSQAVTAPSDSFEVASIKPSKSGERNVSLVYSPGGRFRATNTPLKMLIRLAYNVQDFQISGAPGWINSERYNIEATSTEAPDDDLRKLNQEQFKAADARRRRRVQSLLADRFKLTLHRETKEFPVYALVVAKNGPKLQEAADAPAESGPPDPKGAPDGPRKRMKGIRMDRGEVSGYAASLSFLADALSNQLGRTVLDRTGLKGLYDFTLKWTPDESQGAMIKGPGDGSPAAGNAPPPPDASGPSIFTAVQEQLGLKLNRRKARLKFS
ncbi:MAG: M56 and DUF3738 domain-containing protein [Bryobacteraceae bacterium]